jgi:23S rRNA (adenine2503-C2)-methyltransferase
MAAAPSTSKPGRVRVSLFGIPKSQFAKQLADDLGHLGWNSLHTDLLWGFIYRYGKTHANMQSIVGIRRELREQLAQRYTLEQGRILTHNTSEDGTRKFLMQFGAGQEIESVFIPESTRGTLCVSSQVGCTLSCSFCHTGTQPVMRNLTTSEILSQIIHAKRVMNDFPTVADIETRKQAIADKRRQMRQKFAEYFGKGKQRQASQPPRKEPNEEHAVPEEPKRTITNIVFMGQGEPFYNYRNVKQAIDIICEPSGISLGQPKITVSTSGVVPNIYRLAADTKVNLAISLHAANNELRDELVPINKQYPLEQLMEACRSFISHKKKRIMFEYVMLKDVNDREEDALELATLLSGFPNSLINLIPFNPWPGTKYECSTNEQIIAFHKTLTERHRLLATIRWPRGRDIMAACGQLKTHHDRMKAQGTGDAAASASVPHTVDPSVPRS